MATKRCPMCHRVSEASESQCSCGYEFGQSLDAVRELLRSQRINTSIGLVILLALTGIAFYATYVGVGILAVIGLVVLMLATLRNARKLVLTQSSLRQFAARALPVATLHKDTEN